ncbi:hypothetical protein JCM17845_05760 [Iodidimonas gelatinilytica]|uniref:Uncharacterized protein n=1 Tax=Iodidimonas gelatinilytica TaxID=1236966 RepID=A0A5A7MVC6_9PROT|nr:hypothetical protein JCM17845_05760 [Iodidimonas gelatinilytica]
MEAPSLALYLFGMSGGRVFSMADQTVATNGALDAGGVRIDPGFLMRRRVKDLLARFILFLSASVSVFVSAAIVYILISESLSFFEVRISLGFSDRYPMDAFVHRCPLRYFALAVGDPDCFGHRIVGGGACGNRSGGISK